MIQDPRNSEKRRIKTMNKESHAARGKSIGISNIEMLRERSVFVFNDRRIDRNSEATL